MGSSDCTSLISVSIGGNVSLPFHLPCGFCACCKWLNQHPTPRLNAQCPMVPKKRLVAIRAFYILDFTATHALTRDDL